MNRYTDKDIARALEQLNQPLQQHWTYDTSVKVPCLRKSVQFVDFREAFGFMAQVALLAERADHHPDWSNSYRQVEIALRSHDAGGVSQRDFELAADIERVLARWPA